MFLASGRLKNRAAEKPYCACFSDGLPLLVEELRLDLLEVVAEPVLHGRFYYVCLPVKRQVGAAVLAVKNWLLAAVDK